MRRYTSIKISNIIISLIFILIGISDLKNGAAIGSRFYQIDNIVVRIIGVLFIVFSIGLLFRKEFARKGIIFTCLISILELIVTYNYNDSILEIFITFIFFGILFAGPLTFFMNPKVKEYFYAAKEELKVGYQNEVDLEQVNLALDYKHSGVGIASFVIAIINMLLTIVIGILANKTGMGLSITGQVSLGLSIIFIGISSLVGLPLGIAGLISKNTKKVFSIWGTILNGLFVMFLILVILTAIVDYKQINQMINRNII